jgi:hypothetical protein
MINQILMVAFLVMTWGVAGCQSNEGKNKSTEEAGIKPPVKPTDTLSHESTIPNVLPEFVPKTDSGRTINEGYWRQFEFVSKDQKTLIEKEFEKIRDVQDNYTFDSANVFGYKKVAVRDLITQQLSIPLSRLESYFPGKKLSLEGLAIKNHPGQVKNGFYFQEGGISYLGILENGIVKILCIYSSESDAEWNEAVPYLSTLLKKENLYLVDWDYRTITDDKSIFTEQ